MSKSWLLCVLLGTLAWGQAQPGMPAQAAAAKAPEPATDVPESAVVLTIKGVCAPAAKTVATSKAATAKTAPASKPADCKTEITRAQFEKIANGLAPSVTPQLKRQLEQALPRIMAMSEAARAKGLDKSPQFVETLKIARMQILTTELQRSVQDEADKIPESQIEDYYKKNPEAYEQYSLDRVFIPRYKQVTPEEKADHKEPEKLTEDEEKAKEAADKARQEEGEQEMTKLADTLRARAANGEDFVTLQKEAFAASGTKIEKPTVNLPSVRRTALPPAHSGVFDLKAGEVSVVISDSGGHYIYKVASRQVLPLDDQLKSEIHNKLKSERIKEMMDKYTNSFQAVPNEAYFGPAGAAGPTGRMGMGQGSPRMQHTQAPPPAQQMQPQSAAPAQAPPSKPNE